MAKSGLQRQPGSRVPISLQPPLQPPQSPSDLCEPETRRTPHVCRPYTIPADPSLVALFN